MRKTTNNRKNTISGSFNFLLSYFRTLILELEAAKKREDGSEDRRSNVTMLQGCCLCFSGGISGTHTILSRHLFLNERNSEMGWDSCVNIFRSTTLIPFTVTHWFYLVCKLNFCSSRQRDTFYTTSQELCHVMCLAKQVTPAQMYVHVQWKEENLHRVRRRFAISYSPMKCQLSGMRKRIESGWLTCAADSKERSSEVHIQYGEVDDVDAEPIGKNGSSSSAANNGGSVIKEVRFNWIDLL